MADIVLAQISDRTWLVKGEALLDDLLMNTLSSDITIELVTCHSESEVNALWHASVDNPAASGPPWLIHPGIAERVSRMVTGDGVFGVLFGAWSAARDAKADAVIGAAARHAMEQATARVVLTSYVASDGPAFAGEMANLRAGMVEAELLAQGVASSRIERAREETAEAADRIDIHILPE